MRERERDLAGYTHCRFCDGYYKGFHICGKAWTYCKGCKGYFGKGHKCP